MNIEMTGQRDENQKNFVQVPKPKILICESEPDIQTLYKSFLNGWGATIVDTGDKCLGLVTDPENVFDMVVIDSHIKGLGAIETLKKIREIAPKQHVVITSTNPSYLMQQAQSARIHLDGNNYSSIVDVIEKPFRFSQLLSLLRSKVPPMSKVGLTDHVLAIYDNSEGEFDEAFAFLKRSVQNNETALFIVRKDYDIEVLKAKLRSGGIDVDWLISNDSLIIMYNEDWYIPDKRVDKYRIINQWNVLVDSCTKAGKNGLRAFCMMDCFFEHDFTEEVVEYEHTLPTKFEMPFIPICAYRKQDIDRLSEDQKRRLVLCHSHVWTSNESLS